jgi:hypothetical protein
MRATRHSPTDLIGAASIKAGAVQPLDAIGRSEDSG